MRRWLNQVRMGGLHISRNPPTATTVGKNRKQSKTDRKRRLAQVTHANFLPAAFPAVTRRDIAKLAVDRTLFQGMSNFEQTTSTPGL